MKKELVGSIDRITEQTAYIILNDDEHELQFPLELLPDGLERRPLPIGRGFLFALPRIHGGLATCEPLRNRIQAMGMSAGRKKNTRPAGPSGPLYIFPNTFY